tara:strand:- start:695 stop:1447 length:753 start_codon:yes stop_codon:yes gene_type:complete
MTNQNITVCIAVYNGGEFLSQQLESILSQITPNDEIIIVDDCSSDKSLEIINKYLDSRIFVIKNHKNLGPNKTFEKAIYLANNNFIFLSDQDDIWLPGRINLMKEELIESEALLLSSNTGFIDVNNNIINIPQNNYQGVKRINSNKYFSNIKDIFIGVDNYYGCGMVFKKELVKVILPFPSFIESHDLWIAKCANILKSNIHLEKNTLNRRLHENNYSTKKRSLRLKIYSRIIFLFSIFIILIRIIKNEN